MDLRWFTDPIGNWLLRTVQSKEVKEYVENTFPRAEEGSDTPAHVPEAREMFLKYFEKLSKRYAVIVVILVAAILLADRFTCGSIPNQYLGLTIEVVGAVLLGKGLLKGAYSLAAHPGRLSTAHAIEVEWTTDAVDGFWGISLLLVGITVQFIALVGVSIPVCGG